MCAGAGLAWWCLLLWWVCVDVFEVVSEFRDSKYKGRRSSCDGFLNVFPLLTFCMADSFLALNQDTKPDFLGQCYQTSFSGAVFHHSWKWSWPMGVTFQELIFEEQFQHGVPSRQNWESLHCQIRNNLTSWELKGLQKEVKWKAGRF